MAQASMHLSQQLNRQLTLGCCEQHQAMTYRYEPQLPKPAVHPVRTMAGVTISGFEMSDHLWHRGLWFTIKFINGVNYWEEQAPFGTQVSQGEPQVQLQEDATAVVQHELAWTDPQKNVVVRESRTLHYQQQGQARIIDWQSILTPQVDVVLDRTPYTTWGGYGGLAFRGSRELHNARFHLPQGDPVEALTGQPHPWVLMDARIDGGPDRSVWLGIINHPENVRSPSPWYCKAPKGAGFTFLNSAFLFHEPMSLQQGEALRLRYRVAWGDGPADTAAFGKLAESYLS